MDVKDLILQSENSLPTLQENLSTTTVSTKPSLPTITASPTAYFKFGAGTVMGVAGSFYLIWGKKEGSVNKMVLGAALTLASIFFF
jgi:hypothetical protein